MLTRLSISNYALIEKLDLLPGEGLSIVTGETGAGKSVMLGALALLRGERADLKIIGDKEHKAVVEGVFENLDAATAALIEEEDPEWDGKELIIRREIYPSGRSRAFVNDIPATLPRLNEIARNLFDIHSQNSNSLLSQQRVQLMLLDAVGGNGVLLEEYTEEFKRYVKLRQQIKSIKEEAARNREQAEIISFKLNQLDKLKPKAGELRRIEARYETLSNSEDLRERLVTAHRMLDGDEGSGAVEMIERALGQLADVDFGVWEEEDPEVQERLKRCVIEIKDIVETIEDSMSQTEYDPATLNNLSKRMQAYYTAMKTFRANSDEELEELHNELQRQFETVEGGEKLTDEIEKEAKVIAGVLREKAAVLTERRRNAAVSLREEIEREARKLGLENLRFDISVESAKLSKTGGDNVTFKVAFNKNQTLSPVGEMASGGEMARLMLAVKKSTVGRLRLPTLIFDEIDTGVSGHIADRMGDMMAEMGKETQILTITHLPQVAVKGRRHFKVYKEDRADRTISDIMLLSEEEREEEIAGMLSGEEVNEASRRNARALLGKK